MSKVRWGILSTAKIGIQKVIPAMQRGNFCAVTAIASRDLSTAQSAAQELGISSAYGSYDALLQDSEVDAIYNPLPNHLHVPWSIKALEAGKHVLCEKPIGLTSAEGQRLVDAGKAHPELKLMEAFMFRHHPQWQYARSIVAAGTIGSLRCIQSFFSYFNDDADNIRNMADIGGGGLMDIGCYNISLSRFVCDAEPERVVGVIDQDPNFKTDRLASAILQFPDNVTSTFTCSTQLSPWQRVNIFGTLGRIEIEIPFNAPPDQPCRTWLQTDGEPQLVEHPTCDQYTVQGDLMSQAILNKSPVPTLIEDAVANMKVIEAVKRSAEGGDWTTL
jgi:predicted dehydrogenase